MGVFRCNFLCFIKTVQSKRFTPLYLLYNCNAKIKKKIVPIRITSNRKSVVNYYYIPGSRNDRCTIYMGCPFTVGFNTNNDKSRGSGIMGHLHIFVSIIEGDYPHKIV